MVQTPVRDGLGVRQADGWIMLRDINSDYRDGAEQALLELLADAKDLSSYSDELIGRAYDWPSRYHLEPARANLLRALQLPPQARVLELGAGCGAVTRYLGESCALVDAVEPVPARAAVARARTRDLSNVEVFVGELADVPNEPAYDLVVVIGVLEYVGNGTAALDPYQEFLGGISTRLALGGTLVLAIENKLGVKYLAGAPEDHTNRSFDSLEGYPYGSHARTFSRAELAELLSEAGFEPDFKSAFPDYKLTRAVLGNFPAEARSLLHRIPQFPSPDWLGSRPRLVDERLLWKSMVEAELSEHFANSFVVLAGKDATESLWPADQAAAFFSVGRRTEYTAATFVEYEKESVRFRRIIGSPGAQRPDGRLQVVDTTAAYRPGLDFIDAISEAEVDVSRLLAAWVDLLDESVADADAVPIDLVPHNLVVAGDQVQAIDIELTDKEGDRDAVVRRGIFWLANRAAPRTIPSRWPESVTVRDLACHFGAMVQLDPSGDWLEETIAAEAELQAEVLVGPPPGLNLAEWTMQLADGLREDLTLPLLDLPLGVREPERLATVSAVLHDSERDRVTERNRATEFVRSVQRMREADEADRVRTAARLKQLTKQNAHLESTAISLVREVAEALQRAADADAARHAATQARDSMAGSRGMRALGSYRRLLERGLPAGSARRAVYRRVTRSPQTTLVSPAPVPVETPIRLLTSAEPEVSIVIPVYGKWEFTRQCLQSIASHWSSVPFEVIVVDDASPDATLLNLGQMVGVRVVQREVNGGFIAACNAGIEVSKGRFVVLLNNDTEVTEGWLDALVDVAREPGVGVVGARLVYPDGRLQEAGGIIFSDGHGWNFGRHESSYDPRYNFRRSVDYCSGAALLIRRDLLAEVGGMDSRYAPAYYEDTDICFSARARGLDVVYQPAATVIHHEGVSHGTDIGSGIKAYQQLNRLKFTEKWADVLAGQPANDPETVPLTPWRGTRGIVLMFDHYVPEPDEDAGSKRELEIVRALLELGYGVVFVPDNGHPSEPHTSQLRALGVEVLTGVFDFAGHFRQLAPMLTMAIVARPDVGWRFIPLLREHVPDCPIVYDTVDLHFLRERRAAALTSDPALDRRSQLTRERELALMRLSDAALVVSPAEVEVLGQEANDITVRVLSLIQDSQLRCASLTGRADLLFIGSFAHPPNADGIGWFIRDVLPIIRQTRPDVRLRVVGRNAPVELMDLGDAVEFLGWVPDVEPEYAATRVTVAPLRFGAGVKGKVVESLSYGVPVVTTPVGAEGTGLVDGSTARIAADAPAFARAVLDLLEDDAAWRSISDAGLAHVDEHFGREATRSAVLRLLEEFGAKRGD
jgi:GT2 family glycosyltransferase/glycosyltransferase involved in cell wall biosynthesis/SAM-dependent methyltransferase